MQFSNTEDNYGVLSKMFHWLVAVLILGLLPVGLFMGGMENSPIKFQVYALHKSFGLLVLFLGVARLVWRFISPAPDHLENHKPWERALAAASHFWLYICIIGMPLSGWLMSSAGEFPVPFFGVLMPQLIDKNEQLGDVFYQVHEVMAYTLLFVLALHMAGALKHHVLDRDETLQRMTWKKAGIGVAVVAVLVAGASYAVSGLTILKGFQKEKSTSVVAAGQTRAVVDISSLGEHGWAIVPDKSRLTFKASLYGAEFEGTFNDFSGSIVFNPDDLSTAKADIRIGMKDVKTGDADRDSNIQGEAWFDSEKYPDATFKSMTFEAAGAGKYVAVGNLTLRGVTMPVSIPFTLDIKGNEANMMGDVTLNRLDFRIGTGEWEDDKTVGQTVKVKIDLTAIQ